MGDADLSCPHCGYNLTGLPENRCPECGEPFDPSALARRGRHRGATPISRREWLVYLLGLPVTCCVCMLLLGGLACLGLLVPAVLAAILALVFLLPVGLVIAFAFAERLTARYIFLTRGPVAGEKPFLELFLVAAMLAWEVVLILAPAAILLMLIGLPTRL